MPYLALYRKYRPTTFDEVIGQQHITTTLVNQINSQRVGHAYLFTGTRGTGKTSVAKIFAKAINCLQPINGSPCNKCKVCVELSGSGNIDIFEMDAASNNRVDEIREIREAAQYPPVTSKYKVYIIDEVHMLTDSAFNALLKTLEEPPSHAVFVLATTEAHKLPQTVISRCMRFDFRLVAEEQLVGLLQNIFKQQNRQSEPEALTAIARAGGGSVRDSLSLADMCLSYAQDKLTYTQVLEVLGATNAETLFDLFDRVIDGDMERMFTIVDDILSCGKNVNILNKDFIAHLRNLLVIKTCNKPQKLLSLPKNLFDMSVSQASRTDAQTLLRAIELLSAADTEMRYSMQPRLILETALLKITDKSTDLSLEGLSARIKVLENNQNGQPVTACSANSSPIQNSDKPTAKPVAKQGVSDDGIKNATKLWGLTLGKIRTESGNPFLLQACKQVQGCYFDNDGLVLLLDSETDLMMLSQKENAQIICQTVNSFGNNYVVRCQLVDRKNSLDEDVKRVIELCGEEIVKFS